MNNLRIRFESPQKLVRRSSAEINATVSLSHMLKGLISAHVIAKLSEKAALIILTKQLGKLVGTWKCACVASNTFNSPIQVLKYQHIAVSRVY